MPSSKGKIDRDIPKVLLIGNGLNLSYNRPSQSWSELLKEGSLPGIPDNMNIPFSLEVVLRTNDRVQEKMQKKAGELYGSMTPELSRVLNRLLGMGFDEILTTNYSYEAEMAFLGTDTISDYRLRKLAKSTTGRIDARYMLHSYNELASPDGRVNRIWHIHGEAKKTESMIIDHYHYGELLNRFVNFFRWRKRDYDNFESYNDIPKESWLDAYMLGDVYILGQGMDFSEMDLWWLLNRKKLETANTGRVLFYEPRGDRRYDQKIELLRVYGAEVRHLGFKLPPKPAHSASDEKKAEYRRVKDDIFRAFYEEALKDIEREMNGGAKKSQAPAAEKGGADRG